MLVRNNYVDPQQNLCEALMYTLSIREPLNFVSLSLLTMPLGCNLIIDSYFTFKYAINILFYNC